MSSCHSDPARRDNLAASSTQGKSPESLASSAARYIHQAEKLSYHKPVDGDSGDVAVEAQFATPGDPVLVTEDGRRLPAVSLKESHQLNVLKEEFQNQLHNAQAGVQTDLEKAPRTGRLIEQPSSGGTLKKAMPPTHTHPLFPPLPLYGPPTLLRGIQCRIFRFTSFFLSMSFLGVIVIGALSTSIVPACRRVWQKMKGQDPDAARPFYEEELRRARMRQEKEEAWKRQRSRERPPQDDEDRNSDDYIPTEGGPDRIKCDIGYYARRVGLDVEDFEVQTEDGFIIDLWHVFDPREYAKLPEKDRQRRGPEVVAKAKKYPLDSQSKQRARFPVLLMPGLLQSAGAYCVNDDDSLAFFLCKSGFDVWLGSNRCGFQPKHELLDYSDPRMWCWNIRQMGVFDLPALVFRVIHETGFEKIGLICHSQGTAETLVVLAKEQRPELGEKLTVFCALAPAAYAGPLIGKMYFKFMRIISPSMFRLMFGIHAFIPIMMTMHSLLPPRLYGQLGYTVFSFLFSWTDARWDRALRDRMFQFAPVYVSAESMRWWLGRECFARHKCILATKEEWRAEELEDKEHDHQQENGTAGKDAVSTTLGKPTGIHHRRPKGSTAWYSEQAPPFALWVCGNDALVDGERLLRRFENGREPHVNLVHRKVIPEFEHLDVIWAIDAVDQVFKEIREVLWKTCEVRDRCRIPQGCENVPKWVPKKSKEDADEEQDQSSSGSESC
ncbi:hypothetical protein VTK73DRAFT_5592 [Phialemonium thermophilum]|uniref:Partial AB-hydrolase lipase domain-containing protein n=1 Tax=Phialemonium thermophilum TaxID=223376 RepID=A0ABR3WMS1_9PEZI